MVRAASKFSRESSKRCVRSIQFPGLEQRFGEQPKPEEERSGGTGTEPDSLKLIWHVAWKQSSHGRGV